MKLKKYIVYSLAIVGLLFSGCNDVFDKENLNAINPDDVWNNKELSEAYINNIYGLFMPGFAVSGGSSDEAPSADGVTMSAVLKGSADVNSINYWPYASIRKINILLEEVENGTLPDQLKENLKGQALFFRSWAYFGMTRLYGGVPLVLRAQGIDEEDLSIPRSNAKDCIAQIIKDLDAAIALLPEQWEGGDYGRIDKGIAMAFKGRVLLFYASPQFNPSNDTERWTSAYQANSEALTFLRNKGKELYQGDFENIWYEENNSEAIMVNQYFNPGHTFNQNMLRPLWATKDNVGGDRPSLQLVNAFPMKDGSAFDPANGYGELYKNRDNRFYATIAYNGTPHYNIKDLVDIESHLWMYFNTDTNTHSESELYESYGNDYTGFYRLKGVDKKVEKNEIDLTDIDWIEIRFTEVLMNFGEAANEIGKTDEAMQVLKDVRQRAGIEAGIGDFGITATGTDGIREAYISERFVEFAFENKRWNDLRRWRRFDILNDQVTRKGLKYSLNTGETAPKGYDNIDDVWDRFSWNVVSVEASAGEVFNLKDEYYFFGIPENYTSKDVNLEQTIGWDGGTFDPLK